jgi:hypothetical protein
MVHKLANTTEIYTDSPQISITQQVLPFSLESVTYSTVRYIYIRYTCIAD